MSAREESTAKELRERLPGWLNRAPEMPGLLHDYLKQATEGNLVTRIDSQDLARLQANQEDSDRRTLRAISGGALLVTSALLTGLEVGPWYLGGLPVTGLVSGLLGAWLSFRAHKR